MATIQESLPPCQHRVSCARITFVMSQDYVCHMPGLRLSYAKITFVLCPDYVCSMPRLRLLHAKITFVVWHSISYVRNMKRRCPPTWRCRSSWFNMAFRLQSSEQGSILPAKTLLQSISSPYSPHDGIIKYMKLTSQDFILSVFLWHVSNTDIHLVQLVIWHVY